MASVTKRKWTYEGVEREKWVVRYVDLSGRQRQETFEYKKQADAAKRRIEGGLLDGTHMSSASMLTVAQVVEQFMRLQEDRRNEGVIGLAYYRGMTSSVDNSILPLLGRRRLAELTAREIEQFYRAITRSGKLSPETGRRRLYLLKLIFDFAIRHDIAKRNPVPQVFKELGCLRRKSIRTFALDDVRALLKAAETRRPGQDACTHRLTRCVVNIAAFCGLRIGEIFALKRARVDLNGAVIEVRHSITLYDEIKGPKTDAGVRDVPMPAHVVAMLREFIALHYQPNEDDLIFKTGRINKSMAFNRSGFRRHHWYALLKAAGLAVQGSKQLHFHALRHFAASMMISQNVPITDVAQTMGHASFDETLQTYAHPLMSRARRTVAIQSIADTVMTP